MAKKKSKPKSAGAAMVAKIGRPVPFRWVFPESVKTAVATNIVIQHTEDSFILSFFEEFSPLIVLGTPEERAREAAKIDSVEARCVARIRCTPAKAHDFLKALGTNVGNYDVKHSKA